MPTVFKKKGASFPMVTYSFVGSLGTVRRGLEQFIEQTGVDELIVSSVIYDHSARLRSYEIPRAMFAGAP